MPHFQDIRSLYPVLFFTLICCANGVFAEEEQKIVPRTRIISAKNAKIKTGSKTLQQVSPGEVVIITQKHNEWLWIPLIGGWIKESDVKKPEELIVLLSKSISSEPTVERYHLRGIAYQVLKKNDKALADLNAALKIRPDNASILVNRGNIWRIKNEYDKALTDLNRAIQLEKTNANAFNIRGLLFYETQQTQKAIDDFSQAIQIQPQMITAFNARGIAYRQQNHIDLALKDFNQAIKINSFVSEVFSNRAAAWEHKTKYAAAIQDYKRAIELNPTSAVAHNDLAWLYATCPDPQFQNPKAGVTHAEKACEFTHFQDANMLDTLATACQANREFAKAVEYLKKAIALSDTNQKKELQDKLTKFKNK